jgi:hypothetical protein
MKLKLTDTVYNIIVEDLLNEASGPLAAFENIIKAAGKTLIGANEALLFAVKKVNPQIKQLIKASDEEIGAAMAKKEFREYRQIIAKGLINRYEKEVDAIIKKADLSTIDGKARAAEEITKKTGIREELSAEIVKLKSKKSPTPKPVPPKPQPVPPVPPVNIPIEEISATRRFLQGMNMSVLDYLKKIPVIQKRLSKVYYQQLEPLDKLKTQFDSISDKMKIKLSKGGDYDITDELKEMNGVLSQFAIQKNKQQTIVWKEWKNSVGSDFVEQMKDFHDEKFQEFFKYFESTLKVKNPPSITYTKMDAAKKMFTWGPKGFWGNLNVFRKRLGNSFLLLDPRTFNEVSQNLEKYGKARGLGKEFGDKLLATLVFWPTIFGGLQTTLDYIDSWTKWDVPIGDETYVKENEPIIHNYIFDNTLNVFRVFFKNYFDKLGVAGEEITGLFGWSPALYLINKKFWGGENTLQNDPNKLKSTIEDAKKDVQNFLPIANDTLSKNQALADSLKKLNPNIDVNVNTNDGSYESFKQFCRTQNPPLTPDADTGNKGIYSANGVEYEWNGSTFIKSQQ